jgi:hypothetical protein
MAVWRGPENVWAIRFSPDAGWGVAEGIAPEGIGSAFAPQVVVDPAGNTIAVWAQDTRTEPRQIWVNRFTPASGWGAPERIQTNGTGSAGAPLIAVDPDGQAFVLWVESHVATTLWASRFTPTDGWSMAERIMTEDDAGDVGSPQIAVDAHGRALAVWTQAGSIWSSRFE